MYSSPVDRRAPFCKAESRHPRKQEGNEEQFSELMRHNVPQITSFALHTSYELA